MTPLAGPGSQPQVHGPMVFFEPNLRVRKISQKSQKNSQKSRKSLEAHKFKLKSTIRVQTLHVSRVWSNYPDKRPMEFVGPHAGALRTMSQGRMVPSPPRSSAHIDPPHNHQLRSRGSVRQEARTGTAPLLYLAAGTRAPGVVELHTSHHH